MFPGIDHLKAQTLFHYCAKSTARLIQRDYVRLQLEEQIKILKKIGDKNYKKRISELENRISTAIALEKQLKGHHSDEDQFHDELTKKVDKLDKKLGVFLEGRESRTQRIRELEKKIMHQLSSKTQKTNMLRNDIKRLEMMHRELSKTGKYKKKLQVVDQRIAQLKGRLKQMAA